MRLNPLRAAALVATALTLVLVVTAGARQGTPKAKDATATKADPAPSHHDHSAMGKTSAKVPKPEGKYMTIVGEVMDPACFLEAGSKSIGPGHYQCAYDCARSGQTLAIYARDEDRIYFIAGELPGQNPNVPLLPYVHKKVDVTGTVYHRSDAWGIVINKVALHQDKAGNAGGKSAGTTGAPAGK